MILRPYPDLETVDLSYYPASGYPEPVPKVERDPAGTFGSWHFPDETPRRKPTVDEQLEAAEARGERVPRIGLTCAFIQDDGDHLKQRLVPYRAVVRAIHSPTEITADVYLSDTA